MATNPVSTLKKDLAEFSKRIKARKDKLADKLAAKNEKISSSTGWRRERG